MLLENKVIVVTGAASPRGIGKATAQALAAHGARIAILDLRRDEAEAAIVATLAAGHMARSVGNKKCASMGALGIVVQG